MEEQVDLDVLVFQLTWERGSRLKAIKLAREYIGENIERLMPVLGGKDLEELVALSDEYRTAGRAADVIVIDMWVHAGYTGKKIVQGQMLLPAESPSSVMGDAQLLELASDRLHIGTEARKSYAQQFVNQHREALTRILGSYTLEELVALVDTYRLQNKENDVKVIEAWLLAEYEPQHIVGEFDRSIHPFLRKMKQNGN